MAKLVITKPYQRLDQIVFNYYGDLSMFDAVVEANPHLTGVILAVDDEIALPTKAPVNVEETLW